jgi:cyclopropane fatty-acyl-phospholipid synthase-like methyltransferase
MSSQVDLYGTTYSKISERVYTQIRLATYGIDFGQSSWVTAEEYRRFFQTLELRSSNHVLDVGCGSGGPAMFMAEEVGCRVTGIDINEAGVQVGEKLAKNKGLDSRISFRLVDVSGRLPFADMAFDAIVCMDAICHMPARGDLFKQWHRLLRPGGRMLFTDPVVVTGLVTKDELQTRSSTGHFEFCPVGINERLIQDAGFELKLCEDVTQNEVDASGRWHDARAAHTSALIAIEGEATFSGLQRFLATAHRLTSERRLSRYVYMGARKD